MLLVMSDYAALGQYAFNSLVRRTKHVTPMLVGHTIMAKSRKSLIVWPAFYSLADDRLDYLFL